MKPMPIPSNDCSKEEAIEYLSNHIETLNEKIDELEKRWESSETEATQRAWAMDRAIRVFDRQQVPTFDDLKALADNLYGYTKIEVVK